MWEQRVTFGVFRFWSLDLGNAGDHRPATGSEVDAGIDLDVQSFAALPRNITPFSRPHCDEPHLLAGVQAWLGELRADQK